MSRIPRQPADPLSADPRSADPLVADHLAGDQLSGDQLRGRLVADRCGKLADRLGDASFDALLLTGAEAVDYATGFRSVPGQIHADHPLAALVTPEQTQLIASAADSAPAIDGGFPAENLVPFGRFYFAGDGAAVSMTDRHADFDAALGQALSALRGRRVGIVGPTPTVPATNDIRPIDANVFLRDVRAVKLPIEQDVLRRAAELAEDGIETALAIAAPGVSERELAAAVAGAMVAGGGDPRFVVVTVGARTALADAFPSDKACAPGDLLRLDVGCQLHGYWSDIARTAVLGEPTARQQRRYDALLAGVQTEFELATVGRPAGALFSAAVDTVVDKGISPYRRHHVGHAIGLSVYEHPVVRPDEPAELAAGMVFCLETPYYEIGWGGMMVEDTGVVTGDGFELFTSIDRSLRVVGP